MLLTGSFRRSLDEKQRLALPKSLRDVLGVDPPPRLYMTPGTDRSLAVYTEQRLTELGQQLAQRSPAAEDVRAFSRLFYARATALEPDRQGRIRIPQELKELANLEAEVVLIGAGDHLELWSLEAWEAFITKTQSSFDQIAEKAFAGP